MIVDEIVDVDWINQYFQFLDRIFIGRSGMLYKWIFDQIIWAPITVSGVFPQFSSIFHEFFSDLSSDIVVHRTPPDRDIVRGCRQSVHVILDLTQGGLGDIPPRCHN